MKLCINGIHPVKREQQSCCWHGGVIMGWCDLISCAGPTWDDVGTGHSWGEDIRWGSGVEETRQYDAHCFHSGDALKVRCPPAPPLRSCALSLSAQRLLQHSGVGMYFFLTRLIKLTCFRVLTVSLSFFVHRHPPEPITIPSYIFLLYPFQSFFSRLITVAFENFKGFE